MDICRRRSRQKCGFHSYTSWKPFLSLQCCRLILLLRQKVCVSSFRNPALRKNCCWLLLLHLLPGPGSLEDNLLSCRLCALVQTELASGLNNHLQVPWLIICFFVVDRGVLAVCERKNNVRSVLACGALMPNAKLTVSSTSLDGSEDFAPVPVRTQEVLYTAGRRSGGNLPPAAASSSSRGAVGPESRSATPLGINICTSTDTSMY